MLVLSWHFSAAAMYEYSKEEFEEGELSIKGGRREGAGRERSREFCWATAEEEGSGRLELGWQCLGVLCNRGELD